MSNRNILADYYYIHADDEILYNDVQGYSQDNTIYFIMPMENNEIFTMEQIVIAYFLKENGYHNITLPIQNKQNEWFTSIEQEHYIVSLVEELQSENRLTPGEQLAYFHEVGATYPYEPQEISSYGKWKDLWIYKLSIFEERAMQRQENFPHRYNKYIWDVFPYLIGMSENAIQYVQETDAERRFHEADQATVTIRRYTTQLEEPILLFNDLCYDHRARDIAEAVRHMFLHKIDSEEIRRFLTDYEAVRPLSIFSWRLVYARLIFPIQLFDALERLYKEPSDETFETFVYLMENQDNFTKELRRFFDYSTIHAEHLGIPVLNWL